MSEFIIKDCDGNIFLSFEKADEKRLDEYSELTHCLAVVTVGNDHLLGWNKWRKRWEIFGGCIEKNEMPRECIIRECNEELGIENGEFIFLGIMKFLMTPDYFSPHERIEYGCLYGIALRNISIDEIYGRIKDRSEIAELALYSNIKGREFIAEIDEKLLEYF